MRYEKINRSGDGFSCPLPHSSGRAVAEFVHAFLVWKGADGRAWISYNEPACPQARHNLPPDLVQKSPWWEHWLQKQLSD